MPLLFLLAAALWLVNSSSWSQFLSCVITGLQLNVTDPVHCLAFCLLAPLPLTSFSSRLPCFCHVSQASTLPSESPCCGHTIACSVWYSQFQQNPWLGKHQLWLSSRSQGCQQSCCMNFFFFFPLAGTCWQLNLRATQTYFRWNSWDVKLVFSWWHLCNAVSQKWALLWLSACVPCCCLPPGALLHWWESVLWNPPFSHMGMTELPYCFCVTGSTESVGPAIPWLGLPSEFSVNSPSHLTAGGATMAFGVSIHCSVAPRSLLFSCLHRSQGVPLPSACPPIFPRIVSSLCLLG